MWIFLVKNKLFFILFILSIFVFFKKDQLTEIPIHPSKDGFIILDSIIEEKIYPFQLSLERPLPFINKKVLTKLKKTEGEILNISRPNKKDSLTASYKIPKISFGIDQSLVWKNVSVLEDSTKKETLPLKNSVSEKNEGFIGSSFLEKTNLFFDLQESKLYACNNLKLLQRKGIAPRKFVKTPINIHSGMLWIEVETDFGILKLALSTDLHPQLFSEKFSKNKLSIGVIEGNPVFEGKPVFSTEHFLIAGKDFGAVPFITQPFEDELAFFDGFIGISFLRERSFYIDYKNKTLHIDLSN